MLRKFILCATLVLGGCATGGLPHTNVSQLLLTEITHGLPVTEEGRPAHGNSLAAHIDGLVDVAHLHGFKVYVDEDGVLELLEVWGMTSMQQKRILLNSTLDDNGAAAVLAHEIAHVLLPQDLPEPDDDIAAQAVSFIIMGRLGLDTSEETLNYYRYMTHNDSEFVKVALMRYGKVIDAVAEQILAEMKLGAEAR